MRHYLPWLAFALWSGLFAAAMYSQLGHAPIDFVTYRRAGAVMLQGGSPFLSRRQSSALWLYYHHIDVSAQAADAGGQGQKLVQDVLAHAPPGPYLYPPTLGLLIAQLRIDDVIFESVSVLSILAFGWLWLKSARGGVAWLLLIAVSWDAWDAWIFGNVELMMLAATLLAAWLLWIAPPRRWALALLAAPAVALVLLIKPFYVMFFAVFVALQVLTAGAARRDVLRVLLVTAAATAALVALEAYRWGSRLQDATLYYSTHSLDSGWFVLPRAQQTPMSAWNRTLLQGLVNAGIPASTALVAAMVVWLVLAALTLWVLRGRRLSFAGAFAPAFILLYWGRPIGWTLIYLDVVVAVTLWPYLRGWWRALLLGAVAGLLVSHWAALILTLTGHGLPVVTLQSAAIPWETWGVIPLSWLAVLLVLRRRMPTPVPGRA